MTVVCSYCGRELRARSRGVWRKAVGWIDDNRKLGGANALVLPERLNVYACDDCISALRAGISPHQEKLL